MKRDIIIGMSGGVAGTILTASLLVGALAIADQDPTTDDVPRYIPYSGTIEYNGATTTLTGADAPWMRFEITDGQGGTVVLQQDSQVEIYAGKFQVLLGLDDNGTNFVQSGDLATAVANADNLFLEITLLNTHDVSSPNVDTGNDNVALSNPQRLLMSPFAFWATHATDFDVAQALEVGTTVSTGGNITAGGNFLTTNDIGINTTSPGANLHIDVGAGQDRPFIWANQFTVDSEDGTGLVNLVGGAYSTTSSKHKYIDTRGASRLVLGDGQFNFHVGNNSSGGHAADEDVTWTELMELDADDTSYIYTPMVLGNGTPASGFSQLELSNNQAGSAGDNTLDDFADYQLLLHRNTQVVESFGIGVQSSTMFFNSNEDFRFYRDGVTVLQLDGNQVEAKNSMTVGTDLSVGDDLSVTDQLSVGGNVNFTDCRICILYGDSCSDSTDDCGSDKSYACVKMEHNNTSDLMRMSDGGHDGNDGFRLKFVCDNGSNDSVTGRGSNGSWP